MIQPQHADVHETTQGLWRNIRRLFYEPMGRITRDLRRVAGPAGIGQLPVRLTPDRVTTSVCGFCATGCGLSLHLQDETAINVTPARDYPVNRGSACPKGWEALSVLDATDRATTPLLRTPHGVMERVDWRTAIGALCYRFRDIQTRYGNESIAFLGTGQLPTEELALLGALAKFGMGMVHGDGNTRQCMATAATAYKQSFGFDAPPYTYEDFEQSDVIVLVGSNLCIAHPILWERICRNRHNPTIVAIDPRRTETAMASTRHLAIAPKSDLVLFNTVAQQLITNNWVDSHFIAEHTIGFSELAQQLQVFDDVTCSKATGLTHEEIDWLTRTIRDGKRVSFWWTMGVNQSHQGVRTAQSLINLALLTGNIGRPGTGANSITGQCNAMGSRLFSNTTNLFGGRDFENEQHRADVAKILDIDVQAIPTRNSWPYHQILEGIRSKAIRGLWIVGTNPAHSWIDQHDVQQLLASLDFLVVQDMYHNTETARYAHLVLPAAGWGEKQGTFVNSERRISVTHQVRRPPGEAKSDFAIFRLVADTWGCGEMFRRWTDPEAAFQILGELSRNQPCDFSGINDYQTLAECGGVQWPCVDDPHTRPTHKRLFENGEFFHPDHRARFVFGNHVPMPETVDLLYPFVLITGRGSVAQWHTQTRTAKSPVLQKLVPATNLVEIHPRDATRHEIVSGDTIKISSRRGSLLAVAVVNAGVGQKQLFISMHDQTTNQLTFAHFDPLSHQPAFKDCAVRIEQIERTGVRT